MSSRVCARDLRLLGTCLGPPVHDSPPASDAGNKPSRKVARCLRTTRANWKNLTQNRGAERLAWDCALASPFEKKTCMVNLNAIWTLGRSIGIRAAFHHLSHFDGIFDLMVPIIKPFRLAESLDGILIPSQGVKRGSFPEPALKVSAC